MRKVSCKPRTAQRGSWRGGIGGRRMVVNGMRMEGGSLKIGMGLDWGRADFILWGEGKADSLVDTLLKTSLVIFILV